MCEPLNRKLGEKGYTMVARAPSIGVEALADGSWHILAGSDPSSPEEFHHIDHKLIPFILASGGDIVLYRLPLDGIGPAIPVLSRGGMTGRPPALGSVSAFDRTLVDRIEARRVKGGDVPVPVAPRPRRKARLTHLDARAAAAIAAVVALLAGGCIYASTEWGVASGLSQSDLDDPKFRAIRAGATQITMPRKGNPEMLEVIRVYPSRGGRNVVDHVDSFQRKHYEQYGSTLPPNPIDWRRPE